MRKKLLRIKPIAAVIIISLLMSSCSHYYKAISVPLKDNVEKAAKIDSLKQAGRTLVLRNGDEAFLITNAVSNVEENKIQCKLEILPLENKLHLTKGRKEKMKYKKSSEGEAGDENVLREAHIYIEADTNAAIGQYNIALTKISQIEVIEKDKQRTTGSYVLGAVIGVTAIAVVALVIFAATFTFNLGSLGH